MTSKQQARGERERAWFAADVAEARKLLRELDAMGGELIRRAAIPVDDGGFPAGTGGEGTGRSSDVRDLSDYIVHRDHLAELEAKGGFDPDPVRTHTSAMVVHLGQALESLRRADAARADAVRVPASELGETREVPGCVNCARWDIHSPVHRRVDGLPSGGRCRACYEYRRRHDGRDAPESIVTARPEVSGRRRTIRVDPAA